MKSIKEITDKAIDIVHENTYVEPEPWTDDDGTVRYEFNLSPEPSCYEKLHQYFAEVYADVLVMTLKNQYGKKEV